MNPSVSRICSTLLVACALQCGVACAQPPSAESVAGRLAELVVSSHSIDPAGALLEALGGGAEVARAALAGEISTAREGAVEAAGRMRKQLASLGPLTPFQSYVEPCGPHGIVALAQRHDHCFAIQ